jgi:hypothetical protein
MKKAIDYSLLTPIVCSRRHSMVHSLVLLHIISDTIGLFDDSPRLPPRWRGNGDYTVVSITSFIAS